MSDTYQEDNVIVVRSEPVTKVEFIDFTGTDDGFGYIQPQTEAHTFPLASLRKELRNARARGDYFTPADLMLEDMLTDPGDQKASQKLKMILSAVMLGREYEHYDEGMQLIDDYTANNRLRLQAQVATQSVPEGASRRCALGMGFAAAFVLNAGGLAASSPQPPTKTRVAAIVTTLMTGFVFGILDFNGREAQISWKDAAQKINERISGRLYMPQAQAGNARGF